MMGLIPIAIAFQVQVGVTIGSDSAQKARQNAQRAEREAMFEAGAPPRRPQTFHRIPLTDAMRASAFKDPAARDLLLRAREARLKQDSALLSYDATTYQRVSAGLGFKAFGRDRLAMRAEEASRVQWEKGRGALVDVKGSRAVVPIAGLDGKDGKRGGNGGVNIQGMSPIPYYPGRNDLWIGGGLAQSEVDETQFVHPIAEGAEAYYTYQTGDSVIMTLPDAKRITLRELKIEARWPKWNLSVGSFWFDESTAHLVRAVYRISMPMDVWTEVKEESEVQKKDRAARDSANKANGRAGEVAAIDVPQDRGRGGRGGALPGAVLEMIPGATGATGFTAAKRTYDLQVAKINEFFDTARQYQKERAAKAPGFKTDLKMEAMIPVLEGKVPLAVSAARASVIHDAIALADKQRIRIVILQPRDIAKAGPELKAKNIPVILGRVLALPEQEDDPYDGAFTQPAEAYKAGVKFAFGTFTNEFVRNLPYQAATAVAFGLPYEEALKAVTINPAQIWGHANDLGSVEKGKVADLIVTTGDPLEISTQVKYVFIKGKEIPLVNKQTRLYEKYMSRQ